MQNFMNCFIFKDTLIKDAEQCPPWENRLMYAKFTLI